MTRKYTIKAQDKPYFVIFTIVEWVDVFTRNIYKDIFMESLIYCQKNKGLEPIALPTNEKLFQKLNYMHQNSVEAGFVEKPEDWVWSSAGSYAEIRQSPIELIYI